MYVSVREREGGREGGERERSEIWQKVNWSDLRHISDINIFMRARTCNFSVCL